MQFAFQESTRRWTVVVGALFVSACVIVAAPQVAQAAGKSTQTQAIWVGFDPEAETVTVKVKKPGRGKDAKRLKRGKKATFNVKVGGSVLTKTTVAINGKRGELAEIPEGKTVFVYWRPDETDDTQMFARKVDVIFSDAEWDERYKAVDE